MPFLVSKLFKQLARQERMKTRHSGTQMYADRLVKR